MNGAYAVDLDQLSATVESLAATDARLSALVDELHLRVAALQHSWTGLAADEHAGAHRAWESGCAEMRRALEAMREAGRVAHDNYGGAARLNTSLWERLR